MELYPVFPLPIVILPGELVALHLFEPRYKELYRDSKDGNAFVIVNGNANKLEKVGTVVKIHKVIEEKPNGTIDLVVKGITSFEIKEYLKNIPNKLYSGVLGSMFNVQALLTDDFKQEALEYFKMIKEKEEAFSCTSNSFELALEMDLPDSIKQKIIAAKSTDQIIRILKNEITLQKELQRQEKLLKKQFFLN